MKSIEINGRTYTIVKVSACGNMAELRGKRGGWADLSRNVHTGTFYFSTLRGEFIDTGITEII